MKAPTMKAHEPQQRVAPLLPQLESPVQQQKLSAAKKKKQ